MPDKSIIIIGAGVAGLSAGCYARMNGYKATIFEMHDKPGGLCTAWKREGYTFDGCIHDLAGAGENSLLYPMWRELGAFPRLPIINHDQFMQVETPDGRVFHAWNDIEKIAAHMKELAPADAKVIEEYRQAALHLSKTELLAIPMTGMSARLLPMMSALMKWGKVTLEQFGERLTDPFLRRAFPRIQYDLDGVPMVIHINFLAACQMHKMGTPRGGSLVFARAIEERFRALGGEVCYKARVRRIIVENDTAVGVELEDGTQHRADVVIAACDGRSVVMDMLGGKYVDKALQHYYTQPVDRQPMNLHVGFGVARDLSNEPRAIVRFLEQPVTVAGDKLDRFHVEMYGYEPDFAPAGRGVINVPIETSYSYWRKLREQGVTCYEEEKERVASTVLAALEPRFPGIAGQLEVWDVATPLTVEYYTGNWQGMQAWPHSSGIMGMISGGRCTLPGLRGLFMTGHWAGGMLGVSTAAIGGRKLIEQLCRRDGTRFVATA